MLKKVAMLLCVFGAAAVLTGCSSLQTASVADFNKQDVVSSGTAVEHIAVATHGLYLFSIPLITGSTHGFAAGADRGGHQAGQVGGRPHHG